MKWKNATDKELLVVMGSDRESRLSDVCAAKEEYERRSRKIPTNQINFKRKAVYPK